MKPLTPIARRRLAWLSGITVAIVGIALYARFDPGQSVLAPKCPFRLLTGLDCPACGSQRALHALLHAEWAAALHYNPFLMLSIPYLLLVCYTSWGRSDRARRWRAWVQHPQVVRVYFVLLVGWWIVRNTPLWQ